MKKDTILTQQFLIITDQKIASENINKKIKNSKTVGIYSTTDAEFGAVECEIHLKEEEKKETSSFYYITTNSLNHIKLNSLIKKIDTEASETGLIKVESKKIYFYPIVDEGKNHPKDWNKTFSFDVDNGVYKIFQFDFYIDGDQTRCDTMFSVKGPK